MKKSMVILIAALTFFLGVTGGIMIGIVTAPVKKGIHLDFSFKNCGIKHMYKIRDNYAPDASADSENNTCIPKVFHNKKKGLEKWIGRK